MRTPCTGTPTVALPPGFRYCFFNEPVIENSDQVQKKAFRRSLSWNARNRVRPRS